MKVRDAVRRIRLEARALRILIKSGTMPFGSPRDLPAIRRAVKHYGLAGSLVTLAALRHGDDIALDDDRGVLTYRQLEERSNSIANGLHASGVGQDDGVAILCRNHRGLLEATFGVMKVGARALFLNTDFSAPQAREVCEREGVQAIVYDEEFADVVAGLDAPLGAWLAWHDSADSAGDTIDGLIETFPSSEPPIPTGLGQTIILTSGTTGTPKGATREQPRSLVGAAALFSKVPLRVGGATFVAPPMFHSLGLGAAIGALSMGSRLVIRRHSTPEEVLDALEEHRCTVVCVVPVILRRLVEAQTADPRRDLSALEVVYSSGSQLEGALATAALGAFGDVIYNLYGSTEVAYASIATPEDLHAAPGCVGSPPLGSSIRILDEAGRVVRAGETGRIVVSNGMEFDGYTDGSTKEVVDGYMSSGDVGHVDASGRLFIDGRDDEMIISGGENLFPREIEELLAAHDDIVEAAAIGVADSEFGQRLRVFVVVRQGSELSEADVRMHVKANLARYKVPRDVVFLDALPRNPTGKVLKRELARWDDRES